MGTSLNKYMVYHYAKETIRPKYDVTIIPHNWCPTRFFSFHFRGWNIRELDVQEPEPFDAVRVGSASIQSFYDLYHDKYAFTDPIFEIHEDGSVTVKIAIMALEQYQMMREKYDNTTKPNL